MTDDPTPQEPSSFSTTLLFLTDVFDTNAIGRIALLQYRIRGKTSAKPDKAGLQFRVSDAKSAMLLYEHWNPMITTPPTHLLKYAPRPGMTRLTDAHAIAKRVSIIVHPKYVQFASRPTFTLFDQNVPRIKPIRTRLQLFTSAAKDTGKDSIVMTRVIYCFSTYREVHIALRSMITLGKGDVEESQVGDLWIESDYFSPTNFCPTCGDQGHLRAACEDRKSVPRFCGFCGGTDHQVIQCPRKGKARSGFTSLARMALVDSGYDEFTDFRPCLRAILSHPLGTSQWALSSSLHLPLPRGSVSLVQMTRMAKPWPSIQSFATQPPKS